MNCRQLSLVGILMSMPGTLFAQRQVAVTVDDLPIQGRSCQAESAWRINRKLLAVFREYRVPTVGFVTESRGDCGVTAGILKEWLGAGHQLGNHSASHFDLNNIPAADFVEDVRRGERTASGLLRSKGERLRYFRHPYLHTGDAAKKEIVEKFLAAAGYRVAPVTFDNQEWVYAAAYERAEHKSDEALKRRVGDAYILHMRETVRFFENRSMQVLGREPAQILLLHANLLNADQFGRVAAMLVRRGYRFVSLDEVLRDPVYHEPDIYVGSEGLSWIHRWGLRRGLPVRHEPREAPWVSRMIRD